MVHDNRVEGAILRAEAAIHAYIGVDEELCGLGNRPPGARIVRTDDPDALGRADLGADPARCAADLATVLPLVVHEEGHVAELLRDRQLLLGILHGEDAARILAGAMRDALGLEIAPTP
jgi:hypothetical protein